MATVSAAVSAFVLVLILSKVECQRGKSVFAVSKEECDKLCSENKECRGSRFQEKTKRCLFTVKSVGKNRPTAAYVEPCCYDAVNSFCSGISPTVQNICKPLGDSQCSIVLSNPNKFLGCVNALQWLCELIIHGPCSSNLIWNSCSKSCGIPFQ